MVPLNDFEGQNIYKEEVGRIPCQESPSIDRNEFLKVEIFFGNRFEGEVGGREEGGRRGGRKGRLEIERLCHLACVRWRRNPDAIARPGSKDGDTAIRLMRSGRSDIKGRTIETTSWLGANLQCLSSSKVEESRACGG